MNRINKPGRFVAGAAMAVIAGLMLGSPAQATIRWHASIGASYKLDNGWEFTGAYTHAFNDEKSGANQTPGFGQPVTLQMSQNELIIGFSKSWRTTLPVPSLGRAHLRRVDPDAISRA